MTRFNRFQVQVREALLRYWDPIGVADTEAARDEYDRYVIPIANKVVAGTSLRTLSTYLVGIEVDSMGLKGDHARARSVAAKLQSIARSV